MDLGLRGPSYNAVPQFGRRKKPEDATFGKKPFRGAKEEEEEELKKKAEFRHFPGPTPKLHIIA
jgi:hypothetical protein